MLAMEVNSMLATEASTDVIRFLGANRYLDVPRYMHHTLHPQIDFVDNILDQTAAHVPQLHMNWFRIRL